MRAYKYRDRKRVAVHRESIDMVEKCFECGYSIELPLGESYCCRKCDVVYCSKRCKTANFLEGNHSLACGREFLVRFDPCGFCDHVDPNIRVHNGVFSFTGVQPITYTTVRCRACTMYDVPCQAAAKYPDRDLELAWMRTTADVEDDMLHHEMPAFVRNFMGCTCGGVFLPISSHQDFDLRIGGQTVSFDKCCPESTNTLFAIIQSGLKRPCNSIPITSIETQLVISRFKNYAKHQKLLLFLMRDEGSIGRIMTSDASRSHQVGDVVSARNTYKRLRRMAEQTGWYFLEYESLQGLGKIALGEGEPQDAFYLFNSAFKVIDFIPGEQIELQDRERAEVAMLMCEAVRLDILLCVEVVGCDPSTSMIKKLRTSVQLWTQYGQHGLLDTDLFESFSHNIMGLYHEHERGGPKDCVDDYTNALHVSVAGRREHLERKLPTANTSVIRVYEKGPEILHVPGYLPQAVEMELWHAVQGLRRKLSVDEFKRVLDAERVEFVPM